MVKLRKYFFTFFLEVILSFLFLIWISDANLCLGGNFYQENRNGRVFVLQYDNNAGCEIVFDGQKNRIFLARNARRLAVLPTAGRIDDFTNNRVPPGCPEGPGTIPGDPEGIITLRLFREDVSTVRFDIYRGQNTLLYSIRDRINGVRYINDQLGYDIAVSQYVGDIDRDKLTNKRNILRVYLYLESFANYDNPAIFRFEFEDNRLKAVRFKASKPAIYTDSPFVNRVNLNWDASLVEESGNIVGAKAINVNCKSRSEDLLVYHPNRNYCLQHVWRPQENNGYKWGINYLLKENKVLKAPLSDPLTNDPTKMIEIFDVGLDLGDAFVETLDYYRSYYNHGNTFVLNNVNTNATLHHIYDDIRDPAGQLVEIRDGSPDGPVLEVTRVNPNPTVIGHGATALYRLSCRNALSGRELIIYEPVYKINSAAVQMGEISDNNRNNVPDHIDNDGKGYWGYREKYFIDRTNRSTIDSDYVLDFVIAHRFSLIGVTANNEFSYTEYAIEREPTATSSRLIPGETVRVRVGNIYHRDPDVYGEYNQFGWDGNPGNGVLVYVGRSTEPYNQAAKTSPYKRNSGHILGIQVKNTSHSKADFFGVVGTDDYNQGQGDLYFLTKQFGKYERPRIVWRSPSNIPDPPVTGYGYQWKYQYDRSTYYGVSRTQWLDSSTTYTTWITRDGFFIGYSIYSQMVYNINCGCRGQRYDNYQLDFEASAPIYDFAIVNIGAPPWVTGGLYPTIKARAGTTVFEPDAKVTFEGGFRGRSDLLARGGVGYRFVILENKFIDNGNPFEEPYKAAGGAKIVDSYDVVGGYLENPVWSYTFRRELLPSGNRVATFVVYLGIKYNYYDYSLLPYPAYSWDEVPSKDFFAWSDSKGGNYTDGRYYELMDGSIRFGAPLLIRIESQENLSPDHPVEIDKLEVVKLGGSAGIQSAWNDTDNCYVVNQNEKFKIVITGKLLFLSEIPEPRNSNFDKMGGILPSKPENYRVFLNSDNKQYYAAPNITPFPDSEFAKDLEEVKFEIYMKANIRLPDGRLYNFTITEPYSLEDKNIHYLYREGAGDNEINGWQAIASGSLNRYGHLSALTLGGNFFENNNFNIEITPDYRSDQPNKRRFRFKIETPWAKIPIPLDANSNDIFDKYAFRVGFKYKVGKWVNVKVKERSGSIITDSYNASNLGVQKEMSFISQPNPMPYSGYIWKTAQRCLLKVLDTEGPKIDGFNLDNRISTGDSYPSSDVIVKITDNNPHDYLKLVNSAYRLRVAFQTGKDKYLNLTDEDKLGFDYGLATSSSNAYEGISDYSRDSSLSTDNQNIYYRVTTHDLDNVEIQNLATFTHAVANTKHPVAVFTSKTNTPIIRRNFLYAPFLNPNNFKQLIWVYSRPDGLPDYNILNAVPNLPLIVDGSNNPLSGGNAIIEASVLDNDAPNVRVILEDQANLDMYVEVKGGIRDNTDSRLSRRILTIKESKTSTTVFKAEVSTSIDPTTPVNEIYDLVSLSNGITPPNYNVLQQLDSRYLPIPVTPDIRFKAYTQAYDSSGQAVDINSTIVDYKADSVTKDLIENIFRRGLVGNIYTLQVEVSDQARNKVTIRIPLRVMQPSKIEVRTIEEDKRKQQ